MSYNLNSLTDFDKTWYTAETVLYYTNKRTAYILFNVKYFKESK